MQGTMKKILIPLLALFVTVFGAQAQVVMRGDVDFSIRRSRIRIDIDDLTNFNDVRTDRLRFRVWASEHHWTDYRPGHLIALGGLPRLQAHQNRHNVHNTVHLHYPDTDWYHITVTVEERVVSDSGTTWEIRDAIEFDDQVWLADPDDFWPF
jgi:hypothetical protein